MQSIRKDPTRKPADQNPGAGMLARFIGFAGVGVIATATQYSILFLLVAFADASPTAGSSAGFLASALLNYYLNHRVTFRSSRLHTVALPRFAIAALTGLAINAQLMWLLTENSNMHYLLAQLFSSAVVLSWNFWISERWTFR